MLAALSAAILLQACDAEVQVLEDTALPARESGVTEARLLAAGSDTSNWLSHGRTYDEQRFSPLDDVNAENVADLGLDWFFDVPTHRGIESTPLVIDGVMFVTGAWSTVFALDAKTGEQIWATGSLPIDAWSAMATVPSAGVWFRIFATATSRLPPNGMPSYWAVRVPETACLLSRGS